MYSEFVRVDDRFVHGQVLLGWVKELTPERIIVGCDRLKCEERRRGMYEKMSTPDLMINVLTITEASELVSTVEDSGKVMVIFGSLADALAYCRLGRKISKVNVGCLRHQAGKERVTDSVFLGKEDRGVLREFVSLGVAVEAQGIPGDKRRDLLAGLDE
jgi:fructose-specific PTS system IIB component